MNRTAITIAVVLLLILAGIAAYLGFFAWQAPQGGTSPVAPVSYDYSSWKSYSDPQTGVSFMYPEKLAVSYISLVDWPPKVQVIAGPFSCAEAGLEVERAGRTEPVTVGGHTYCVTRESEGAAGSIYTNFAYAMPRQGGKVLILTWSIRAPQCENYDEPRMSACAAERASFSMDPIADQILQSAKGV